jgi:enterochelin esterase-like enzyme/ribosomal protein S18 acetylase RimI-like enzyme
MITYRQIVEGDIPALLEIRLATWGNDRAAEEMAVLGINADSVLARLRSDHSGWVACLDGKPAGFAMANRSNGELWVVAVLPEGECHNIGNELMRQAEAWLFSHGWQEIWLTTHADEDSHVVGFYHHLGWVDWKTEGDRYLKKINPRSTIKLEEHTVTDPATGYTRLVRLQRGPSDQPHRLCLFLDGEHYWRDMDAVPVLNDLCDRREMPRMTFAFVGHVSGAARHEDYTCNERYGQFIGGEVMTWLKDEVPMLQDHGHVVAGLSLSGLMAAYLTLKYPQHFDCCLSQSGSHWWKHEWFAKMVRQHAPICARFWLSVGDQETEANVKHPPTGMLQEISQIAGVEKAAQVLKEVGVAVRYNPYHGGHSLRYWREELSEALPWLLIKKTPNRGMPPPRL